MSGKCCTAWMDTEIREKSIASLAAESGGSKKGTGRTGDQKAGKERAPEGSTIRRLVWSSGREDGANMRETLPTCKTYLRCNLILYRKVGSSSRWRKSVHAARIECDSVRRSTSAETGFHW